MMNLSAYDPVSAKVDKTKTWVNVDRYQLLSREMPYRRYVTISKRYNKRFCCNDYFVILLDNPPNDRDYARTKFDDYGRIKISLKLIWTDSFLYSLNKDTNISIELVEHTDDGDIYKLEV